MSVTVLVTILLAGLLAGFVWRARRREARLLATVEVVEVADFASWYLGNKRPLHIFLPPHYRETQTRYPVLYLNDGQDVEQLRLRETLARLMAHGRIQPLIVVAIPTTGDRLQEYGTAVAANAQGLGSLAAQYNRFVVEEVRLWVNQEFRTETDAAKTAVLGASLGGLSAFDLAWNHPDVFGAVGVFSGSFWWRAGEAETAVPPPNTTSTLAPHEKVQVRASGRYAVTDKSETLLLIKPAHYWHVPLGDHIVMVEHQPQNFLYQFFNAKTLQKVESGWILFGKTPLSTLAITFLENWGPDHSNNALMYYCLLYTSPSPRD